MDHHSVKVIIMFLFTIFLTNFAHAAEDSTPATATTSPAAAATTVTSASTTPTTTPKPSSTDPANFRCEKLRAQTLSDLKIKLLQYCDIEKPFSTSMSISLGEEAYMYCCTVKK